MADRNMELLGELVGGDPLRSVIVVTTMWSLVDPAVGSAREHELKTDPEFLKGIQRDQFMRHTGTKESAFKILGHLLEKELASGRLTFQAEVADETKTAAALMHDFDQLIQNLRRGIEGVEGFISSGTGTSQDRSESEKRIQKMKTKLKELEARKMSLQKGGASISLQRRFLRFVKIFGLRL
jgi:hypothetical protein